MSYAELISKATPEQRREVMERVIKIIGTVEQNTCCIKDLTARVQARARWQKEYERLAKVFLEHGAEALSMNFYQNGRDYEGVTVNGKKWTLDIIVTGMSLDSVLKKLMFLSIVSLGEALMAICESLLVQES